MTTAAMVLGAVPLALAHGAGAESRQAIGWVVVGGLLLGTLLTLFVIPTMYSVLVRKVHLPSLADDDAVVLPAAAGASMGPHQRQEH
jgi:multidrug efflux pump